MNKSDYIDTFKDEKITVMGQGSLYHALETALFRSLRTLSSQRSQALCSPPRKNYSFFGLFSSPSQFTNHKTV